MPANQDGSCPAHTSHFQGADAKQCFVDTALQMANTGVGAGTTTIPATTTTPVTCKTGEHLDTFSGGYFPY
jgi:hypothetical protein